MIRKSARRLCGAMTAGVVLGALLSTPAPAATLTPTTIDVRFAAASQPDLPDFVAVHVAKEAGAAVNGVAVSVYIDVTLFGGRSALLGRAITDTSGTAMVSIIAEQAEYEIKASFAGNDTLAASQVITKVTVPPASIHPAPPPGSSEQLLGGVRNVVPGVIVGLVAVVWFLLIAGLLWLRRWVRHHGSVPLADAGT